VTGVFDQARRDPTLHQRVLHTSILKVLQEIQQKEREREVYTTVHVYKERICGRPGLW
jgi:hypothetical protein